ncbi:MAG: tetratricopeptide repeat protein [Syntrophales bacterium]
MSMMRRTYRTRPSAITLVAVVCACLCLLPCLAPAASGEEWLSAREWFDRGRFMGEIGNYRRAVEAFSRVIEMRPDYAHAYNNRGVAYSEMGSYRLAIQDFNRAIAMNPGEALFRFNRAIAFGKGDEFDLAIRDFREVIAMDPQNTDAHFLLGLIQRSIPGEVHTGSDNIKTSARMGNKEAQQYLRTRAMGWF